VSHDVILILMLQKRQHARHGLAAALACLALSKGKIQAAGGNRRPETTDTRPGIHATNLAANRGHPATTALRNLSPPRRLHVKQVGKALPLVMVVLGLFWKYISKVGILKLA
jgi:hypothetical protein